MPRLIAALLALLLLPALARADGPKRSEHWYIVEFQGQRAGWMKDVVGPDREGADDIRSDTETKLTIKRGAISMTIRVKSRFVETADGRPILMESTMQLGAMPMATTYRFTEDGVLVSEKTGKDGPVTDKGRQPLPEGEWLTPRAAERVLAEKVRAGETSITLRTIDPLMGLKPVSSTHTLLERTNLDVVGKTVPAIKWKSTTDIDANIAMTTFTDGDGVPLRSETNLGGMQFSIIRADKELALAKLDPPELLLSTLIKPDRPIDNPRTLRRAAYLLQSRGDELPDIPTTGAQRFERTGPKSGRLTLDLDAIPAAPPEEAADPRLTDCSSMITCGDDDVKSLVTDALAAAGLKPDDPAPRRAEAMRAFVHRFIDKKNLGVGFATAAEVARTRTGDCSEHGVLLAALLRAGGIPARVVSGLVYVDGFAGENTVFGYHMWAQALLEEGGHKKWIDLDAALSPREPSDATHIALAPSALSDDDTFNSLVKLAPLIGTLDIKIEHPAPEGRE